MHVKLISALIVSGLVVGGAAVAAQHHGMTMPYTEEETQATTPPSAQAPTPNCPAACQQMMQMREKMMGDMKKSDAELDQLVAKMDSATGQAKVDATAALVRTLVQQHKQMHQHMMQMMPGMMGPMPGMAPMGMMRGMGPGMVNCPMMSGAAPTPGGK